MTIYIDIKLLGIDILNKLVKNLSLKWFTFLFLTLNEYFLKVLKEKGHFSLRKTFKCTRKKMKMLAIFSFV